MSDSNDFGTLLERHNKALLEANTLNKASVFDALATAGINTVIVTFDGEGDSGQIQDVSRLMPASLKLFPSRSMP